MPNKSIFVKNWRKRTKQRMINSMGGKCCLCGYNKSNWALDFHHLNPTEKEFSFGGLRASCKSWEKITNELKKCILVCANCHREIHEGLVDVSTFKSSFNPNWTDYKEKIKQESKTPCIVCGKLKHKKLKYCSQKCTQKNREVTDWSNLQEMKNNNLNNCQIGKMLGVSEAAVRKHLKKMKKEIETNNVNMI